MPRFSLALSFLFFTLASYAGIVGEHPVASSIVAADAIHGDVERVFINASYAIRERAIGLRGNP